MGIIQYKMPQKATVPVSQPGRKDGLDLLSKEANKRGIRAIHASKHKFHFGKERMIKQELSNARGIFFKRPGFIRKNFLLFAATLFIFFSATADARVVPSDLFWNFLKCRNRFDRF